MIKHSHGFTRQAWADRIERFELADQTVREFCAAEGVSQAAFYQWRRKLRTQNVAKPQVANFLPVKLPELSQAQSATVMSVELPGGVRVRFEVTSDKGSLP